MRLKQLKKAQFETFPNCIPANPHWQGRWRAELGTTLPLVLELGCGKAEFAVAYAGLRPDRFFIGIDMKRDRLWYGGKNALAAGLTNVALLREEISMIDFVFGPGEIDALWVTFPDPYPKVAHARRRLTAAYFLNAYRRILRPGGEVHFKTDNAELFAFSLRELASVDARIHYRTDDLHATTDATPEAYLPTAYERKFLAQGLKIHYLYFSFD